MEAGSIFLILALALVVGLYVGRPFLQAVSGQAGGAGADASSNDHRRSILLAERDRMLMALQELDFDHRLGKIPDEDYPEMRSSLVQSTAQVLRQLDEIQGDQNIVSVEDRIEKVIAARRADAAVVRSDGLVKPGGLVKPESSSPPQAIVHPNDSVEEMIATRRRDRQEKSSGFCPSCGKPALKSDRFCSRCGTTL